MVPASWRRRSLSFGEVSYMPASLVVVPAVAFALAPISRISRTVVLGKTLWPSGMQAIPRFTIRCVGQPVTYFHPSTIDHGERHHRLRQTAGKRQVEDFQQCTGFGRALFYLAIERSAPKGVVPQGDLLDCPENCWSRDREGRILSASGIVNASDRDKKRAARGRSFSKRDSLLFAQSADRSQLRCHHREFRL